MRYLIFLLFSINSNAQSIKLENYTNNSFEIRVTVDGKEIHHHIMKPDDELNISAKSIKSYVSIKYRRVSKECDNVSKIQSSRNRYNTSEVDSVVRGWMVHRISVYSSKFPRKWWHILHLSFPPLICKLV